MRKFIPSRMKLQTFTLAGSKVCSNFTSPEKFYNDYIMENQTDSLDLQAPALRSTTRNARHKNTATVGRTCYHANRVTVNTRSDNSIEPVLVLASQILQTLVTAANHRLMLYLSV